MSGHNKRSKKRPTTKRRKSSSATAVLHPTATDATDGTPGPSQPPKVMDSSDRVSGRSLGQDPSSGTSSGGTPTTALTPTHRYGFLCFRKRLPRTLVDGRYREHDPASLPEPLKWGFIQWANQQRGRTKPLDEAENLYNNRTLRFWRLSTDYGRFLCHEDGDQNGIVEEEGNTTGYEIANGVHNQRSQTIRPAHLPPPSPPPPPPPPPPQYFWTSPQRPYTAPPHQMNRSPC